MIDSDELITYTDEVIEKSMKENGYTLIIIKD